MAQTLKRLSAKAVQSAKPHGRIPHFVPDGGGLYLQVSATGTKSWMFRYAINGRERQMGLGSLSAVDLAGARQAATECRGLRMQGIRPVLDAITNGQPVPMSGSDVFKTALGVSPLMQPLRGIGDIVNYFRGTNYPRQPTTPATIILPAGET
jgi:hypothetical protein